MRTRKVEVGSDSAVCRAQEQAAPLASGSRGQDQASVGRKNLHPRRSYRDQVTAAALSMWEQDYSWVNEWLEQRRAEGIEDFRRFFRGHPEEVIGLSGTIRSSLVDIAGLGVFLQGPAALPESCVCVVSDRDSYKLLLEQLIALAEGRLGGAHEPIAIELQETGKTLLVRMAAFPGCEQTLERVLTAFVDISATANVSQAMAKTAEKYHALFESAGDAMLLADAATGNIVEANKRAESLLECPSSALIGNPLAKFLPLIETGAGAAHATKRCETFVTRHRSGERVPVVVSTSTVTGTCGDIALNIVHEMNAPGVANLLGREDPAQACAAPLVHLTAREKEILRMIAAGCTNRQIAARLGLSAKTVETHRSRSMRKLNIHNTAALVKHVLFAGLE